MGLPTFVALNLVTQVNKIGDYGIDIPVMFQKVFHGLGTMGEAYSIKLKPGTQP